MEEKLFNIKLTSSQIFDYLLEYDLDTDIDSIKRVNQDTFAEIAKEDWRFMQFVENQTPEICLEAVKQDPQVINYIRNKEMFDKVRFLCKVN